MDYITFDSFNKTNLVNHCFTTRNGGYSKGVYESLNLSFSKGDNKQDVIKNYNEILSEIGSDIKNVVMSASQVHETKIHIATKDDCQKGIFKENDLIGIDGFITDVPKIMLATFYADCVPLYFLDTKNRAIGLSHAGWRGTFSNMVSSTINKMNKTFNTKPEDLIMGIGPAICGNCYEVDEVVANKFIKNFDFAHDYIVQCNEEKFLIDLKLINARIAKELGILNIEISDKCTKCNPDLFFSHRIMGDHRGNMAAFLELK